MIDSSTKSMLALAIAALSSTLILSCVESQPLHVDAPLLAGQKPRPHGCKAAGIDVLERGRPVDDPARSVAALDYFCNRKHARPCLLLAEMYVAGCGVPTNEARAADLFQRACDLGDAVACGELAIGGTSSHKQAKLLVTGCDAGHPKACRTLGTLIARGPSVPQAASAAVELWEKACRHGDAQGCLLAKSAHEDEAQRLVERACALGLREACAEAEQKLVPASRPLVPR